MSLVRNSKLNAEELRKVRANEQSERTANVQLTTKVDDLQHTLQLRDLEIIKLLDKNEMLSHLNKTLEEESRALAQQISHLLAQNQSLLVRALNDKDSYHAEQQEFQEKLTVLHRHKEKLEEKIMEQYHMLEHKKEGVKEKPTFVRRAAKAIIPKSSGSRKSSLSGHMSAERMANGGSTTTEESSVYSADEALTTATTAAAQRSPFTTCRNGQLPGNNNHFKKHLTTVQNDTILFADETMLNGDRP
ncbi:unnamed protein product [Gongylonema pulchrum]|uniref:Uncharacterized protein n=1 Tax=Gongylonema pulchrum TaxID=637853 RepID=A0A3P7PG64_9BILA|nr:unnamed protein product [Gongylonema pulchrum]